ncbi:hypothetical protein CEXT_60891 [Caerostris extrusa]|uniref:Uncharacterized protein n=1 Tax=Caerostris extrusa TaxID=172846 RepID=A0AAV4MF18_CAEEX|nr:hypothetical protein CEXT_60891 [Caerostris extrusa]
MLCMETADIEGKRTFSGLLRSTLGACFAYFSLEMLSNLTDEERCARISRILKEKSLLKVCWILLMLQPLVMHLMRMIMSS